MTNKKKGTLCIIAGGIATAIGAALASWGNFLKSEDDEEKKDESRNATPKE